MTTDDATLELIRAAEATLHRAYRPVRHTVAAAVRTTSGRIYTGVNVEACGYGPCAEPIAIGAAFTAGESAITAIVSVGRDPSGAFRILSPCGNCRQLLIDYAPDARVINPGTNGEYETSLARDLLPGYYVSDFDSVHD